MNGAEKLIRDIDRDLETREDQCLGGGLPDFAEYKYVCGQILGLKLARGYIESLMQTMKDEEDE